MDIKFLEEKLNKAVDNMADNGSQIEAFDVFRGSHSERQTLVDDAHIVSKLDNMLKRAKASQALNPNDIKWAKQISF